MQIFGELLINNHKVTNMNIYNNRIAYVMQDDVLLRIYKYLTKKLI